MTNAYIFINPRTNYSIGGFDTAVIIMKEDGKVVPSVEFYSSSKEESVKTKKLLENPNNRTGFAAPMNGILYPKGSKLKHNDDDTVTVILPEE